MVFTNNCTGLSFSASGRILRILSETVERGNIVASPLSPLCPILIDSWHHSHPSLYIAFPHSQCVSLSAHEKEISPALEP